MPKSLSGAGHPHRQRQKRQGDATRVVVLEDMLITAHPAYMVDVSRFRHSDYWVDEYVGAVIRSGAFRQFDVRPVQRVARLKSDDPLPAHFLEFLS